MVIDIIFVVALLLALILGYRQGLITEIFMLIAVITTAFVAPAVAAPLGLLFTDNELLAFTAGFAIMLLGAVILVWLIAPLLKKLVIGKKLGKINSIIGACVAFVSMILFLSVASTMFNTANIGDPDTEKIEAYVDECSNGQSEEDLRQGIDNLGDILSKKSSMREYFKPRFVEYETLDESLLFNGFMWIGDNICPSIQELQEVATKEVESVAEEFAKNSIKESITDNGTGE